MEEMNTTIVPEFTPEMPSGNMNIELAPLSPAQGKKHKGNLIRKDAIIGVIVILAALALSLVFLGMADEMPVLVREIINGRLGRTVLFLPLFVAVLATGLVMLDDLKIKTSNVLIGRCPKCEKQVLITKSALREKKSTFGPKTKPGDKPRCKRCKLDFDTDYVVPPVEKKKKKRKNAED